MKNLFVYSLCMLAIVCFSCNRNEPSWLGDEPADFLPSLLVKDPKTDFKDGVFTVDLEIESDFEGEVFILMALRHPYRHLDDPNYEECVWVRGFGNEVKVDGYQIRSYHQMSAHLSFLFYPWNENSICYRPLEKNMDFPVFAKKIMAPKGTFREQIKICLPDGHTWCWGEIAAFRNNRIFEESMKIKADPEMYLEKLPNYVKEMHPTKPDLERSGIGIYHQLFPDSSMFSYLTTSLLSLYNYGIELDDYEKEVKLVWGDTYTAPTKGYAFSSVFGSPYNPECKCYEENMFFSIAF